MCSTHLRPARQRAAFSFLIALFLIATAGCADVDRKEAVVFDTGSEAQPRDAGADTGVDGGVDGRERDTASETSEETEQADGADGTDGTDTTSPDTDSPPIACGNGMVEPGEACDDGNDEPGDGCTSDCESTAVSVTLADEGDATLDIVLSPKASETVRGYAETLQRQLHRITGADFSIVEGDGSRGIAMGVADQMSVPEMPDLSVDSPFEREDYLIRTHQRGIHLVGATELAVRHAVWNLLHRAGYRQYFPGDAWEIVPDRPTLELAADELESPAYVWRRLGFSYGSWADNEKRLEAWRQKNGANGAFRLRTGHAWGEIIRANQKTFDNHPEYLGQDEDGKPTKKLCVTEPAVQKMAVDWAIAKLEKHPDHDSVALDPSDGRGWSGCPNDDEQLGSPSNRAVFLANKVAKAINAHFDEPKYVGMYAYNQHQEAPTISMHQRVIPSVATAFLERGNTPEALVDAWSKAGAKRLGLREYYNVVDWSDDLPGEQRASSPAYVERTLRQFYERGARFLTSETSDAWGPTGLGHWMSIRLAWELDEHPDETLRDDLRRDFLTRAFGEARGPIAKVYALLDRNHELYLSDHLVGKMYRLLKKARGKADDAGVRERIRELVLYTRYVDLFRDYKYADGDERQKRFEKMVRFAYRIHDTHMVHSLARFRLIANEDDAVSVPNKADWQVAEKKNPWKSSKPFSDKQIGTFLERGITAHALRDFQPRSYSRELVPATPLGLDDSKKGVIRARGARHDELSGGKLNEAFDEFHHAESFGEAGTVALYTWVPEKAAVPLELAFSVSAENIHGRETGGTLPVTLFSPDGGSRLDSTTIPVDKGVHRGSFPVGNTGLYRIEFAGKDRFFDIRMRNDAPELRQTYEMSPEQWVQSTNRATYLFYVPEGTETIGGFAMPGVESGDYLERPDGSEAFDFADMQRPGYFSVEVRPKDTGKLWRMVGVPSRKRLLMTVPPQVADSADELLLPKEVVDADSN